MTFASFRIAAVALALLAWLTPVFADPIGTETPKFNQQPMLGTPLLDPNGVLNTYYGHDELSTAKLVPGTTTDYAGTFAADDFADLVSTPVVHISWWGSYIPSSIVPAPHAQKFLIAFETDVPSNAAGGFSQPGTVISSQIVTLGAITPASGTFSETQVVNVTSPTSLDGPIYKYNAELANPFPEAANTVYWLKIVALDDGVTTANPTGAPIQWGWHTRDYTLQDTLASVPNAVTPGEGVVGILPGGPSIWHFQDDAVAGVLSITALSGIRQSGDTPLNYIDGVDGPGSGAGYVGIHATSEDLAFELFTPGPTVPEPASLSLLAAGAFMLTLKRRK